MASEETGILKKIMKLLGGRRDTRIFRNNIGLAWFGTVLSNEDNILVMKNPRRVTYGLETGTADCVGWHTVTITPEMVGKQVAVFLAIEVKTETGRATGEQKNFIAVVQRMGGIAGIARSVDEADGLIREWEERTGETLTGDTCAGEQA